MIAHGRTWRLCIREALLLSPYYRNHIERIDSIINATLGCHNMTNGIYDVCTTLAFHTIPMCRLMMSHYCIDNRNHNFLFVLCINIG